MALGCTHPPLPSALVRFLGTLDSVWRKLFRGHNTPERKAKFGLQVMVMILLNRIILSQALPGRIQVKTDIREVARA